MREVDKVGHTQPVQFGGKNGKKESGKAAQHGKTQINELTNNSAMQSTVKCDNLAADIAFMAKNPGKVEAANSLTDRLINAGVSYEKAITFTNELLR